MAANMVRNLHNALKRWPISTTVWMDSMVDTSILRCSGRISGYNPIYIEGGLFGKKLIAHTHEQIMHLAVANTMANVQNM